MPFGSINYLAVVAGTLFNMVLGFLWYGPILGKAWLSEMEKAGRRREDMNGSGGMYAFTLVVAFVSSLTLALIIKTAGASSVGSGILWGAVVSVGVGSATALTSTTFEGRRIGLWLISSLYYLVVFAAQGALYVLWP
jgi:hypothetical protein